MKVSRRHPVYAAVFATSLLAFISVGCQSYSRHADATPRRPAPAITPPQEILRQQAVAERAREVINEGRATTTNEARRLAESEIPRITPTNDRADADWQRYRREVEAQEKFAAELAKMKRDS